MVVEPVEVSDVVRVVVIVDVSVFVMDVVTVVESVVD